MAANWPEKRPRRESDRYEVKKSPDEWYDYFLFTTVREKKKGRSCCFFISSGLATGYNRFDRPIHQVIGGRRVWNLISRAFVGVFCATCSFRPETGVYGNEKIDDNYTRIIIDFPFLYFFLFPYGNLDTTRVSANAAQTMPIFSGILEINANCLFARGN